MDLKISDEQLSGYLEAAVMTALGDNAKELIVQHAVRYLTTPTTGYGGRKEESPLLQAVNSASMRIAEKLVAERLSTDPTFQQQLDEVFAAAIAATFADKAKLAERISAALRKAITGNEY
jgi:hypothetical protein